MYASGTRAETQAEVPALRDARLHAGHSSGHWQARRCWKVVSVPAPGKRPIERCQLSAGAPYRLLGGVQWNSNAASAASPRWCGDTQVSPTCASTMPIAAARFVARPAARLETTAMAGYVLRECPSGCRSRLERFAEVDRPDPVRGRATFARPRRSWRRAGSALWDRNGRAMRTPGVADEINAREIAVGEQRQQPHAARQGAIAVVDEKRERRQGGHESHRRRETAAIGLEPHRHLDRACALVDRVERDPEAGAV